MTGTTRNVAVDVVCVSLVLALLMASIKKHECEPGTGLQLFCLEHIEEHAPANNRPLHQARFVATATGTSVIDELSLADLEGMFATYGSTRRSS